MNVSPSEELPEPIRDFVGDLFAELVVHVLGARLRQAETLAEEDRRRRDVHDKLNIGRIRV